MTRLGVQCYGCESCFEVKGENIRVQLSNTYKYLSLDDPRCEPKLEFRGHCGYKGLYGPASSEGPIGTDTFSFLRSQKDKRVSFHNVEFGCGLVNKGFEFGLNKGPENTISGIFGLAPGPKSFLKQLDPDIKGRFSYCLISWADTVHASGRSTMYFGNDAQIRMPNVQQILMNSSARRRYHLYLRGISVDGKRLRISPNACALDDDHPSRGFLIDSGSPNTVLPMSAYQPLRAAVVKYFAKYKWKNLRKHHYDFDICYSSTPKADQSYPSVVFHFAKDNHGGEVDWVMKYDNMFVKLGDNVDGFCMAIEKLDDSRGTCIFGAYQHANFRVLYDVKNSFLYFAPERCQEFHDIPIA